MRTLTKLTITAIVLLSSAFASSCGKGGGDATAPSGGGDWYFHWNCNGDDECLYLHNGVNVGTTEDLGPVYASCNELIELADRNYGAGATYYCDHSSTGSGGGSTPPSGTAKVTVTPSTASILVGGSAVLTAAAYDANGNVISGASFTWSSSNLNIVGGTYQNSVETAKGVAAGTATLTASSGGNSGSAIVTVTAPVVAAVIVSPFTSTIAVGDSVTLTAIAQDAQGNVIPSAVFDWSTSNGNIATGTFRNSVASVVGFSQGTALIHATSGGHQGTGTVTVVQSTVTTYDGTYSYSYVTKVNGLEVTMPQNFQFIVKNGVISTNPPSLHGVLVDSFGNVSFQGPCLAPANQGTGTATYTGILNGGNPKNGSGSWTCDAGSSSPGTTDHWSVLNGH